MFQNLQELQQSMYQSKDVLEMEIQELWQLMMKQSRWRRLIVERVINKNLKLIDKERKMKQKQQTYNNNKETENLDNYKLKFATLEVFYQHMRTHDVEIMNVLNLGSLVQEHLAQKFHCILVDIGGLVFSRKLVSYAIINVLSDFNERYLE